MVYTPPPPLASFIDNQLLSLKVLNESISQILHQFICIFTKLEKKYRIYSDKPPGDEILRFLTLVFDRLF